MVQLEEDLEESSNVEDIKVCLRMRPLTSRENDPSLSPYRTICMEAAEGNE